MAFLAGILAKNPTLALELASEGTETVKDKLKKIFGGGSNIQPVVVTSTQTTNTSTTPQTPPSFGKPKRSKRSKKPKRSKRSKKPKRSKRSKKPKRSKRSK